VITFAFFWVLLFAAYAADKDFWRKPRAPPDATELSAKELSRRNSRDRWLKVKAKVKDRVLDACAVKNALRISHETGAMGGMTDETKVSVVLESMKPVTQATYRRNTKGWLTGKKPRPVWNEATQTIENLPGSVSATLVGEKVAAQRGVLDTSAVAVNFSPRGVGSSDVAKLYFQNESVEVMEDGGTVTLVVCREGASDKAVTCSFETADISATEGADYQKPYKGDCGSLNFEAGQTTAQITITIIDDDQFEKSEMFRVMLKEPSEGCELEEEGSIAMVTILNDDELKKKSLQIFENMINRDQFASGMKEWKEQFIDAMRPGAESDGPATVSQMLMHVFTVVFKVAFATVPPVIFGGGWPAFCVALGWIAIMTILVGDLAALFGCVIGLDPAITAITFVALGTSMPDTFASKTAAVSEKTADNCVGNVTGSNCVNVFLGLGLPWTIGAIYWACVGKDNDITAAWAEQYGTGPDANKEVVKFLLNHPGEAYFVVEAGSLSLSVIVFTICALVCLGTLVVRRKLFGGELGGPKGPRYASAALFVLLWITYVLVSSFKTENII